MTIQDTTIEQAHTAKRIDNKIPDGWVVKAIKQIGKVSSGGTPDTTNENYWDGNINWCTPTDISRLNGLKYIGETKVKISEDGLKSSSAILLPKNSLIVCTRATIGKAAISNEIITTNQGFKNVVPDEKLTIVDFLYYTILNSEYQLTRLGNGSTFLEISKTDFENFKIPLPPLPEQKAIANILSTWDKAIQKTQALISQKEQEKKWLMQNLLTGKKRLKGYENTKWKIQSFDNFIRPIIREIPKPNIPYLGMGLRSHGKGTFLKHDEQPEKNSMDKFYIVRPNDLIVNITFAWEQAIAIVRPEDDGALASHRFPTYEFLNEKAHPDYFRYVIIQPKMKYMLELISPGGAGRNKVMSKSDFLKLEIKIPSFEEQIVIANVLQTADKEIELLKTKLKQQKLQKKGLMQVLLTGKVRVDLEKNKYVG